MLARKIIDPARQGPRPGFDLTGAVLSAAGLFFVVLGFLQSRTYGFFKSRQDFTIGSTVVIPKGSISPVWLFVAHRRAVPAVVLPARPVQGEEGPGRAAAAAAVPQ